MRVKEFTDFLGTGGEAPECSTAPPDAPTGGRGCYKHIQAKPDLLYRACLVPDTQCIVLHSLILYRQAKKRRK